MILLINFIFLPSEERCCCQFLVIIRLHVEVERSLGMINKSAVTAVVLDYYKNYLFIADK